MLKFIKRLFFRFKNRHLLKQFRLLVENQKFIENLNRPDMSFNEYIKERF